MSDLHDLLHEAAPDPRRPFDPDALRQRLDRRRARRRVTTGVAAVLVLAGLAIGTVAAWPDRPADPSVDVVDEPPAPTASTNPVAVDLPGAIGVTVDESTGAVFATGQDPEANGRGWFVARLAPTTGEVLWRTEVPRVVRNAVAAGGVVWAYGGGDGAEPDGGIVALYAATGDRLGTYGYANGFSPYDAVATDDGLWVTDTGGTVLRVTPEQPSLPPGGHEFPEVGVTSREMIEVLGQPAEIVRTDDGALWVRSARPAGGSELHRIDPAAATISSTVEWEGALLARGTDGAIWTTDGERIVELRPDLLAAGQSVALAARLPTGPAQAAVATDDALWVTTEEGVDVYAPTSFADAQPVPVARATFDAPRVGDQLAVSGGTGWFVRGSTLYRWTPDLIDDPARRRQQAETSVDRQRSAESAPPGSVLGPACADEPADATAFDDSAGTYATYLTGLDTDARTISYDVIQFLTGDAAIEAYRQAHPDEPGGTPPNDYFILNESAGVRTAGVGDDVRVDLVRLSTTSNAELEPGTFAELPEYFAASATVAPPDEGRLSPFPFWLRFDGGQVTAICEQYVP